MKGKRIRRDEETKKDEIARLKEEKETYKKHRRQENSAINAKKDIKGKVNREKQKRRKIKKNKATNGEKKRK